MKLKELNSLLQEVKPFDTQLQKVELEQYPTEAHLAARLVFTAATSFDDVEDKVVVDLGTGTGMLGIGCVMMGASRVIGIDADSDALSVAQQNIDDIGVDEEMELLQADVSSLPLRSFRAPQPAGRQGDGGCAESHEPWVDTVVMNPPFGTRNKGIDVLFLQQALSLRPRAIYSLHKSSTRQFLLGKATRDWGLGAQVLAEMRFDVPAMYKFHKQKSKDIAVDFLRFEVPEELRVLELAPQVSAPTACTSNKGGTLRKEINSQTSEVPPLETGLLPLPSERRDSKYDGSSATSEAYNCSRDAVSDDTIISAPVSEREGPADLWVGGGRKLVGCEAGDSASGSVSGHTTAAPPTSRSAKVDQNTEGDETEAETTPQPPPPPPPPLAAPAATDKI